MYLPMLAVDKNKEFSLKIQAEWQKRGINTVRVNTMQEAIERLTKEPFLYTGINADNVNYLPLLKILTGISPSPVFIITSNFAVRNQTEAYRHGADGYMPLEKNINDNIDLAMALLNRIEERRGDIKKAQGLIAYGDLLVLPTFRQVFRNDTEIELTRYEFNVLRYMMENRGIALTYQQIFENVRNDEVTEVSHNALWCHIRNLRKKLDPSSHGNSYITTLREVGYRFNI